MESVFNKRLRLREMTGNLRRRIPVLLSFSQFGLLKPVLSGHPRDPRYCPLNTDVAGSFLAVFALAVLYECLKGLILTLRERLKNWNYPSRSSMPRRALHIVVKSQDLVTQFSKTCLFVTELCFAYFLMLITMTYNTCLFAAVVTGRGLGYYLATPLVDAYISREETGDYSDYRRDSPLTRRKRQPLLQGTDI